MQRPLPQLTGALLVTGNLWFCWLLWLLALGGFARKTRVIQIPCVRVNLAPLATLALKAPYSLGHLGQTRRHRPSPTARIPPRCDRRDRSHP